MQVTKIECRFFSCANTVPKHNQSVKTISVIASVWTVIYDSGLREMFNITLSNRNPDRSYDSRKQESTRPYFFQIHKFAASPISFLSTIPVASQEKKEAIKSVKYEIPESSTTWKAFDMDTFLTESAEKIRDFVQKNLRFYFFQAKKETALEAVLPSAKAKIKSLKLESEEAKALFHDIFKKYLLEKIRQDNPSVTFKDDTSEISPLLPSSTSSSSSSSSSATAAAASPSSASQTHKEEKPQSNPLQTANLHSNSSSADTSSKMHHKSQDDCCCSCFDTIQIFFSRICDCGFEESF